MTSDAYDRLDAMANAEIKRLEDKVKRLEDKIETLEAKVRNQHLVILAWGERYEELEAESVKMTRDLVRIRDIAAGKR